VNDFMLERAVSEPRANKNVASGTNSLKRATSEPQANKPERY